MTKKELLQEIEKWEKKASNPSLPESAKKASLNKVNSLKAQLSAMEDMKAEKPAKKERTQKQKDNAKNLTEKRLKKQELKKKPKKTLRFKRAAEKTVPVKIEVPAEETKAEKKKIKKIVKAKEILKGEKDPQNFKVIKAKNFKDTVLDEILKVADAEDLEVTIRKKPKDKSEKTRREEEAVDVVNRFIPTNISEERKVFFKKHEPKLEEIVEKFIARVRSKMEGIKDEDQLIEFIGELKDSLKI